MRLGVLDIGSNAAQLQVVELASGAPPLPAHTVKHPTRLTSSFDARGAIEPDGVDRVVRAAGAAVQEARRSGVERLYTFATAAVRDAANAEVVLDMIGEATGFRPATLSGVDEARLTYLAVRRWYGWSSGRLLLLDIGGGSMEVALGRDARPDLALSLPLGAGRLAREFLVSDPPRRDELEALRRHVRGSLRAVADRIRWEGTPKRVIATSKTFKQLARLCGAPPQRRGPFARRQFSRKELASALNQLSNTPAAKRSRLAGVSEARAEQIVAGALTARVTMKVLGVSSVEVCPWALREGLMLHHLETAMHDPGLPSLAAGNGHGRAGPDQLEIAAL